MNKTDLNIYKAFFQTQQNRLYFSQLQDLTNASNSSLQNSLVKFEKENILKKEKTTSNIFYSINDKKIFALEFSRLAYKKFLDLNPGVRIPLKNFLKEISNNTFAVILFGSASLKEEKEGSDIDILVVIDQKNKYEKLREKVNIVSNYPISVFYCTLEEFNLNNDNLIIQAKKTGFPIYGEQKFYEVLLNGY